jgi:1,4-dihydroxy-6-naphthoate synthase
MKIALGFTPGPGGGVIACGLASGRVDPGPFRFLAAAAALPALNDRASRGELEVTMISAAAWPCLAERYLLADCGAYFAAEGGPVLAAREPLGGRDLSEATIATGDSTSSGYVALHLLHPGIRTRMLPPDKIAAAVKMGLADCALLNEGNGVHCKQTGLYPVADLAACWARLNGNLPLPLTCLLIRRDVPVTQLGELQDALRRSIRYGLEHRAEAAAFAREFARTPGGGVATGNGHADAAAGSYVSEMTYEMGHGGKQALDLFLRSGHDAQVVSRAAPLEFAART